MRRPHLAWRPSGANGAASLLSQPQVAQTAVLSAEAVDAGEPLQTVASASLMEGIEGTFAIHRPCLLTRPRRQAAETSLLESAAAGVRPEMRGVAPWKDSAMVLRCAARVLLATDASFGRTDGQCGLRMPYAVLDEGTGG